MWDCSIFTQYSYYCNILFEAILTSLWLPLLRMSALYWYYENNGLVYVIDAIVYWHMTNILFYHVFFKLSHNLYFFTNIESIHLWYSWTKHLHSRKSNPQTSIFDHQQQVHQPSFCYISKWTLKDGDLPGIGRSL